jgi:hypothetical protein
MSPSPPTSRWLAGSRDLIKKSSFPTTSYEGCNTCQWLTIAAGWGDSQSYSYALLQCCQFTVHPVPNWLDSGRKACTHSTQNSRRKSHSEQESNAALKWFKTTQAVKGADAVIHSLIKKFLNYSEFTITTLIGCRRIFNVSLEFNSCITLRKGDHVQSVTVTLCSTAGDNEKYGCDKFCSLTNGQGEMSIKLSLCWIE